MIRKTALVLALIILTGVLPARASNPDADNNVGPVNPRPGISLSDLTARRSLEATLALTEGGVMLAQADVNTLDDGADVYGYKPKSSRRAFLQSLLIPGWGQWYNGSRWKPFLFLGIEAAGIYGWSNFRSNGNDKEDEYRVYADAHWDSTGYFNGLVRYFDFSSPVPTDRRYLDTTSFRVITDTVQNIFEIRVFSHHAYFDADGNVVETDTYYENVGKYDQFQYGWWGPDLADSVQGRENRLTYVKMRDKANKEFSKASTVLILTIGNHLLSAFEAALGAKRYNRALDQFGTIEPELRLTNAPTMDKLSPTLTVRYRF